MARGIVLCTSSHPISLYPDGLSVGPREWAENVDLDDPFNAQAIADGNLTVLTQVPTVAPRTASGEPVEAAPSLKSTSPATGGTATVGA